MGCGGPVRWGLLKGDWFHRCWRISIFITSWTCGLRSALRRIVEVKRISCATAMTLSRALRTKKTPEIFFSALAERLAGFSLEVEPSKTAMLRFGSEALRESLKDGLNRPQTFNFLGFTHFVSRSRRVHFAVGRKTEGKRIIKKLKLLNERLRVLRIEGGKA